MIYKIIIICLLFIGVSLIVIDISERHSIVVNAPIVSSASPSDVFSVLSSKEIRYLSHTSKTGQVVILSNSNARDVSYSELKKFLLEDQTDKIVYVEDVFSCGDYSELLQHNAEMKGIRCAWVYVEILGQEGHSLNAFGTTDQGLIFIDDSGVGAGVKHPFNMDKTVILNRGSSYIPESLFQETGWDSRWKDAGTVMDYKV